MGVIIFYNQIMLNCHIEQACVDIFVIIEYKFPRKKSINKRFWLIRPNRLGNSIILYDFKKIKKTMKTIKSLLFLLLASYGASSQNYYGVNRDLIDNSTPKKPTTEEINKDRNEFIDSYLVKLKAAVNLDELQAIAIKNEIVTNSKNIDIVMKKEDSNEVKEKEVKALMDKTEVVINSYLNKEQKEKYLIFKTYKKENRKEKKSKKEVKKTED